MPAHLNFSQCASERSCAVGTCTSSRDGSGSTHWTACVAVSRELRKREQCAAAEQDCAAAACGASAARSAVQCAGQVTVCSDGSYLSSASTCLAFTTCTDDEYETVAPVTTTTNRQCAPGTGRPLEECRPVNCSPAPLLGRTPCRCTPQVRAEAVHLRERQRAVRERVQLARRGHQLFFRPLQRALERRAGKDGHKEWKKLNEKKDTVFRRSARRAAGTSTSWARPAPKKRKKKKEEKRRDKMEKREKKEK